MDQYSDKYSQDYTEESSDEGFASLDRALGIGFLIFFALVIIFGIYRYNVLVGTISESSGEYIFVNETTLSLDEAAIESAAQSITDKFGLDVGIFFVAEGSRSDLIQRAFSARLMEDYSNPAYDSLIIYIGVENEYSEMGWGGSLERIDAAQIRREVLNPRLNERDFEGALTNSFTLAAERLTDSDAARAQVMSEIFQYADEFFIFLVICGVIYLAIKLQEAGVFENFGSSTNSSSWDSSSSSSSGRSSSSDSSSSSSKSSGGFDGGSWKD